MISYEAIDRIGTVAQIGAGRIMDKMMAIRNKNGLFHDKDVKEYNELRGILLQYQERIARADVLLLLCENHDLKEEIKRLKGES
jgi:hypothetical protein